MPVGDKLSSVFGVDAVGQAAKLSTGAAVGAAARCRKACVTLPGVAHTKRAVDKKLNASSLKSIIRALDFFQTHLARKHHLRKAHAF